MKVMTLVLALLPSASAFAHTYGEHKTIGDEAFVRFARTQGDQAHAADFLSHGDVLQDERGRYYFAALSVYGGNRISYGTLNGLGGDHARTPLDMEAQLQSKTSKLQQVIAMHNQYLSMGHVAAPDGKLARLDFDYALLAAVNLSHFYEYRRTFQEHLAPFDKGVVKSCQNPGLLAETFGTLNRTNSINMYATLHVAAIDLAEQAGRLARTDAVGARTFVHYALLYNGFADHFLEDSFSAGHLVVNRTVPGSLTNNKALHDFYSENGTTVLNSRGEIWYAYGDRRLTDRHDRWPRQPTLRDITYPPYDPEAERIIEAVRLSLNDLATAFHRSQSDSDYTPFLKTIPDGKDRQPLFLREALPSLELIPIPYASDLSTLFRETEITDAMKRANQRLSYREFVQSRIGNSFVVGLNSRLLDHDYFKSADFRINLGRLGTDYSYNAEGGKRGVWDHWHGYTASYSVGRSDREGREVPTHQLRAGVRTNFDKWVSERRVIGLYGYLEVGVQSVEGKREMVLVPSVGVQLGSLLNLNYYNMPGWLRIPVQFLLPLKFRVGSVISTHGRPKWFSGFEMDFVI